MVRSLVFGGWIQYGRQVSREIFRLPYRRVHCPGPVGRVLPGFGTVAFGSLSERVVIGHLIFCLPAVAQHKRWRDFVRATIISLASEQSLEGVFGYHQKMPHLRRQRSVDQDKLRTHTRPWVSVKVCGRSHIRDIGSRP